MNGVTANLTGNRQTFSFDFTAKNVSSSNGRLRIKVSSTDTFYFDNVSLVPLAQAAINAQDPGGRVYLPSVLHGELDIARQVSYEDDPSIPAEDQKVEAAVVPGRCAQSPS